MPNPWLLLIVAGTVVCGCLSTRAPIPGHPGCYVNRDGTDTCYDFEDLRRLRLEKANDTTRAAFVGRPVVELETSPHYATLKPDVRKLSDGSETWTYREGEKCETTKEVTNCDARGSQIGNLSLGSSGCETTPSRVVCSKPTLTSWFHVVNGVIQDVRLQ